MAFRVGMKVEAIDRPDIPVSEVEEGNMDVGDILTIRAIHPDGTRLFFEGDPYEYDHRFFRPIVERKTDTGFSILTEILNGQRVPEKVS